jgi:ribonuclease P protein component
MAKQFTLGRNERLKSRKSIEQLFTEGKKIIVAPYRVLYIMESNANTASLLFAAGVSAKHFKKAVDRNRIKRLAREAWRLQKNELAQKIASTNTRLHVFFIYTGREIPEYDEVFKKTAIVLSKLEKLVAE